MIQNDPIIAKIGSLKLAISFRESMMKIDPRGPSWQYVTTCVVRILSGPKTTFAGVTVMDDADRYNERIAKAISLGRALWQIFPDFDWHRVHSDARFILWEHKNHEVQA